MADPGDSSAAAGRGLFDFSFGAGTGANRSGHSFSDILNVRPAHGCCALNRIYLSSVYYTIYDAATFPRAERNSQWIFKPVGFVLNRLHIAVCKNVCVLYEFVKL